MKVLYPFLFVFFLTNAHGQSNRQLKNENAQLTNRLLALEKDSAQLSSELASLSYEVRALREIVRDYVTLIDSLHTADKKNKYLIDKYQRQLPIDTLVSFPEVEAQFVGGAVAMQQFISENFEYPVFEPDDLASCCKVYISFIVDKFGNVRDAIIERAGHPSLNESALKTIRSMPDWIPAMHEGKAVASRIRLPINIHPE